jgi:hypothetical protein
MKFNAANAPAEGGIDFPKLTLKKDEKARICIPSTKGWEVTVRHFVQGVGYVHCHALQSENVKTPADLYKIQEDMGRPDECIMCAMSVKAGERVGAPQRRFAIRVLRYKTDYDGKLSPGGLKYWLEIWIIDNRKFRELRNILEEWGGKAKDKINQHDLGMHCEDQKYQTMTVTVKKEAAWMQDKDGVKTYLQQEAAKFDLMECLGATMDKDALHRRFAIAERRTSREAPVGLDEEDVVPGEESKAEKTEASVSSEEDIFEFKEEKEKEGKKGGEVPPVEEKKEEVKDFLDDI